MLLIYPPVAKPCEPPAGIARLAGVLRENNIACSLVDMNMECLYYLLNQPQNPEDTWGRRAYKNVAANLEVMRTAPLYDSLDRYKRAAADLNRVIDTVGKSHGVSISLVNYQDPEISPLISKDLLRCASVPEKNIYYPYFSSRLASLIETQSPKMIGFSINYLSQAASAFSMIGYVKKLYPQLPIVAGGGLITSWMRNDHWENPFEDIVDHLVAGPGEEKLLRLYGVENFSLDSPPSYEGLELSQYRELAAFAQFGTAELDKATKAQLDRGQRITEILKQPQYVPMPVEKQVMILYAAINGYIDDVAVDKVAAFEAEFHRFMETNHSEVGKKIAEEKEISAETEDALKTAILDFKQGFSG